MHIAKLLFTAAVVAAVAVPAHAQMVTRSMPVSAAGLDLASVAGQKELDRRLRRAASRLCGSTLDLSLRAQAEGTRCRDEAMRQARTHAQVLIARANSRQGGATDVAAR